MATNESVAELRELIGQMIPEGGSAADTLFTDERLSDWLDDAGSMNAAGLKGWLVIQAHWAQLVNVTDGASAREMSDLFTHATVMVGQYRKLALGPTAGRARVGKIVRSL